MNRTAQVVTVTLAVLAMTTSGCNGAPRDPVEPCERWADDPSAAHPRAARYQKTLDDVIEGHLPGAIALIRDADGLWLGASGLADVSYGVEAQVCHRMPIGSLTKTLTAAVVLRLVDQGRLTLDTPIAPMLSTEVAAGIAASDRITLRMLLDHTSGIPGYSDQAWYLQGLNRPGWAPTQDDALAAVRGRSDFEPGTRHDYGGTNYIVVGKVVEHVTGQRFEEVLEEQLLRPLGMEATRYVADAPYQGIAVGYLDLHGDARFIESTHHTFLGGTPRSPSAGASTSVLDLWRLLDGVFRSGTLLSAASLEAMQTVAASSEDPKHLAVGYGLGIVHHRWPEGEAWGHSGSLLGYEAYAYHFPRDDAALVLLVNASSLSDGVDNGSVHALLQREVLPALRRVMPLTPPP